MPFSHVIYSVKEFPMARTLSFLAASLLIVVGCKTITEELPTSASTPTESPTVGNIPVPLVVTPVPLHFRVKVLLAPEGAASLCAPPLTPSLRVPGHEPSGSVKWSARWRAR